MMNVVQWHDEDKTMGQHRSKLLYIYSCSGVPVSGLHKNYNTPINDKKTRTEFDPNHNCVQYNWVKSQQKYHLWSTVHFDVHFSSINAAPVHQSYQSVKEIHSSTTNLSIQEILTQIKNIWFIVRFTILKGKDTNSSLGIIRISKSD